MMTILFNIIIIISSIIPQDNFFCDEHILSASIRNNLNGDAVVIKDLTKIDEGAFAILKWKQNELMLPVSFKKDEISFTDRVWLWSYKDAKAGLRIESPRLAKKLPNGEIKDYPCRSA